ncbi:MAG TPA: hypothetical protein VM915_03125 [Verrucomicrobiae bacterium]|jgi:hypothetical protein|nr:hypothetical protein [Verrucomicrobiae bacterium]
MTKLDAVLERIRQLPQDRQDAIAVEVEFLLQDQEEGGLLTDEQWTDLRERAAADTGERISHDDVIAEFLPTRGR